MLPPGRHKNRLGRLSLHVILRAITRVAHQASARAIAIVGVGQAGDTFKLSHGFLAKLLHDEPQG